MSGKLKCVIVDDFYPTIVELQRLCEDSPHIVVVGTFSSPKKFLEALPTLDYDLCLLDVFMPEMDGFAVANLIKDKPLILMTDIYDKLKHALDLTYPIDVITKPIKKIRLYTSLEKAYKIIHYKPEEKKLKEYELFHVAESKGKTRLCLQDIIYVETDSTNSRNKRVFLKNGEHYTIMRCSNEKLLSLSPKLVQVNKTELVSKDVVKDFKHDKVTIAGIMEEGAPKKVALNRIFRKDFMHKMSY
jgi:DNA-binding LytR/AlgR family response regulator